MCRLNNTVILDQYDTIRIDIMISLIRRLGRRIAREIYRVHPRAIAWDKKCRKITTHPIITNLGDDLKIRIWTHDVIGRDIYIYGYFEPDMCLFVSNFLKSGMTFIDAGANLGQYTLLAGQKVGPGGIFTVLNPTHACMKN